eukprot:UN10781
MPRTRRNRKSQNTNDEQKNIDEESMHEDMPYFPVPKDVILDVGDGWAATHIGYPHYHYGEKCYVVECIINDKYFRLVHFESILREPEICELFAKHVKKLAHNFIPATATALKAVIESQMTHATSPFNKSDILWYADAPEIVEKTKARIVLVSRTKKIKTFKCQVDLALTTEITHLDSSLEIPTLDTHPICIKPGTLPAIALELLIPARERRKIGERATKYNMVAMSNALESKEWE